MLSPSHIFHHEAINLLTDWAAREDCMFYGSVLLRVESLGKQVFASTISDLFEKFARSLNLQERTIDITIAKLAVELIAEIGPKLRTPDAIHLATALHHDCTHFFTNDRGIRVLPEMEFVTLSKFESNA